MANAIADVAIQAPASVRSTAPAISSENSVPEPRAGFEFIDGKWREKPMGNYSEYLALELGALLVFWNKRARLGRVYVEGSVAKWPGDARSYRKPDVSFITRKKQPLLIKGTLQAIPDLAVEVVSPTDNAIDLEHKVRLYIHAGVRMVWVIFPEERIVHVIKPGRAQEYLTENDVLEGGEILPGFACPLTELFPPLEELSPELLPSAETPESDDVPQ